MLPSQPSQIKTVAISAASIYVAGWGIYYLAQETLRRSHLRSRKKKYPLKAPLLPPHAICHGVRVAERVGVLTRSSSPPSSAPRKSLPNGQASSNNQSAHHNREELQKKLESGLIDSAHEHQRPNGWYGGASDHEFEKIQRRFASIKILGRWCNVVPEWREQGAWEWIFWKGFYSLFYKPRIWWDGGLARDQKTIQGRQKIEALLPVQHPDWTKLFGFKGQGAERPGPHDSQSTFTWIGQSTCLIQMKGVTILTDPVFGDQPVPSIFSPRRMRPMPCSFQDIISNGAIDLVLITHNHFDHLDVSILNKFPSRTKFVVPTGLTPLLVKYGVRSEQITELDWWQHAQLSLNIAVQGKSGDVEQRHRTVDLTALPASHWSARSPLDTNTTLWASYAVRVHANDKLAPKQASSTSLFFCGDTGYSPSLFTAIGRALGPFDVACVPIGSYEPRWHMQIQHMHVTESVQVTRDIGSKRAFAMHWGTWQMSDERWDDPHRELKQELAERGEPETQLLTVPFGKTFDL